jgi:hypothetical protein
MTDPRDLAAFLRRMRTLGFVIVAVLALGTAGLMATEGVGAWRGFVWTLDIVATVGSIPAPATVAGQVVKVALIVLGVGTLFYGLVTVTEVFVSGHLAELLEERRAPCAPRARGTWSSTTTRRCASTRPGSGCASSRASRPTTRCCARPG